MADSPSRPVKPLTFSLNSAATTNATSVTSAVSMAYSVTASNSGAAAAFVKIYDKASAPTVGTDHPLLVVPVGASGVVNLDIGALGITFANGIAVAVTNLVADTDTTAVAANQVKVVLSYRMAGS